jgi:hypothetical protein
MKKKRVLTLIVVVLAALSFTVSPVLATGWSIPFTATLTQNYAIAERELVDCLFFITTDVSHSTLTSTPGPVSHLIDGEVYKSDVKFRWEVRDCDPENPPELSDLTFPTSFGRGILHGLFTLRPYEANGGVWKGKFSSYTPGDGPPILTGTAEGFGGDLNGLELKIFCVSPGLVNAPFNGTVSGSWYTKRPAR